MSVLDTDMLEGEVTDVQALNFVGLTGTREPLTAHQKAWLWDQLAWVDSLDHGACVGADEFGHDIAVNYGLPITVHPPINEKWMMSREKWALASNITVLKPLPFLTRNVNIVDRTSHLLALPNGPYRAHSGTWHTVNYAKSIGRHIEICYPSGDVESFR